MLFADMEAHQRQIIDGYPFSYGDILALIENLEEGELEKRCTTEELWKINHFIVLLAKKGVLPSEINEECILGNDIQELLYGDDIYEYFFYCDQGSEFSITSTVHSGYGEIVLCKNWIHKKWDQTKKFIKKHKKAIIIGTAVVVAAAVVVCTVAVASTAAMAGAAVATSSGSHEKEKNQTLTKNDQGSDVSNRSTIPVDPSLNHISVSETPILKESLEEHISIFKEVMEEGDLLRKSSHSNIHEGLSFGENVRNLGAVFAHQTLDGISDIAYCIPQLFEEIKDIGERITPDSFLSSNHDLEVTSSLKNYKELIAAGHEKIDELFSTDQAKFYTPEAKEANSKLSIGTLPPPGLLGAISGNNSKLLEAGKILDRGGLTKAGRGLMKHGYRKGSVFPKPIGTPAQVNEQGQKVLESILSHPEKQLIPGELERYGKVIDIYAPNIGGVRYSAEGDFLGFLEP